MPKKAKSDESEKLANASMWAPITVASPLRKELEATKSALQSKSRDLESTKRELQSEKAMVVQLQIENKILRANADKIMGIIKKEQEKLIAPLVKQVEEMVDELLRLRAEKRMTTTSRRKRTKRGRRRKSKGKKRRTRR